MLDWVSARNDVHPAQQPSSLAPGLVQGHDQDFVPPASSLQQSPARGDHMTSACLGRSVEGRPAKAYDWPTGHARGKAYSTMATDPMLVKRL